MAKQKKIKLDAPVDVVTFSVDIGVQLPKGVNWDNVTFDIPHDLIKVHDIEGNPIEGATVIAHTTTGPVDAFSEDEIQPATDEELERWASEGGN